MNKIYDDKISIAKALGIITVVIGHSTVPTNICMFISSFHMPLFFYLSGYFFKEENTKSYRNYLIKKMKSIYWQYLKWVLPILWLHNFLYELGIYSQLGGAKILTLKEILIRTCTNILFLNGADTLPGGTWFLTDLFFASLLVGGLAYVLKHTTKIKFSIIMFIISLCCFLLAYIISYTDFYVKYFSWIFSHHMFFASSMIAFGYIFKMFIVKYIPDRGTKAIITFLFSFILLYFFSTNIEGLNIFRSYQYMPSFILSSLIGLTMIISISGYLNCYNNGIIQLLRYMGKHTITIYLMHFMCFKLINFLLIIYEGLDYQNLGLLVIAGLSDYTWIIYTFCGIFLPILLYRIWELYLSKYNIDKTIYPIIDKIFQKK